MPDPWARGYGLNAHRNWEDVSGTVPVRLMGAAGLMISDLADMKRWIELYVAGKTSGPETFRASRTCLPVAGDLSFGLGLGCSAGRYVSVVAWVDVRANEPPPGAADAMIRLGAKSGS